MVKFRRNKKTGVVEVWKNGKKTGKITTMGDNVNASRNNKQQNR